MPIVIRSNIYNTEELSISMLVERFDRSQAVRLDFETYRSAIGTWTDAAGTPVRLRAEATVSVDQQ